MNSKKLDRFITIGFLIGVIFTPLSIALNLCGNVLFNDKQYVSFIKWNDIAIDTGLFILSAFYLCMKLFSNPPSETEQNDIGNINMN